MIKVSLASWYHEGDEIIYKDTQHIFEWLGVQIRRHSYDVLVGTCLRVVEKFVGADGANGCSDIAF